MEEEGIRGENAGKRKQRREGRENRRYIEGTARTGRTRHLSFIFDPKFFIQNICKRAPRHVYGG